MYLIDEEEHSLGGIPLPLFSGGDEDCLFLDLYVPGKALKDSSSKLPVVVWTHGGGYVFGGKDALQPELPFYDGSGILGQAKNGLIFVAMNYRLGAYGFLAGTTMEEDGLPNAGLWDQRAAFQWVQDHIGLVGGDPGRVTAMGESAGASSIMHHLVAQGGKLDPLFSQAILQSPAFQLMWDRNGTVQDTFAQFASLADCEGKGLDCLRAASPDALEKANQKLNAQQTPGTFAVGPTPDGSFIRQVPSLELATGSFWHVDSLILSHCAQESSLFVSGLVQTDQQFSDFIDAIFPNYAISAGLGDNITSLYPNASKDSSPFGTETDRVEAFIRDSCFTCNTRHLTEAFGDSNVWNMQYSVTPGWHATDLVPTFFNPNFFDSNDGALEGLTGTLAPVIGLLLAGLSAALQSYFASYAISGDPNTHRALLNVPPTVPWDHPDSSGEEMAGVVNVGDLGFGTVSDDRNKKTPCDFWRRFAAAATALGGYSPPGAVVEQDLVRITGDPSASYKGGNH